MGNKLTIRSSKKNIRYELKAINSNLVKKKYMYLFL